MDQVGDQPGLCLPGPALQSYWGYDWPSQWSLASGFSYWHPLQKDRTKDDIRVPECSRGIQNLTRVLPPSVPPLMGAGFLLGTPTCSRPFGGPPALYMESGMWPASPGSCVLTVLEDPGHTPSSPLQVLSAQEVPPGGSPLFFVGAPPSRVPPRTAQHHLPPPPRLIVTGPGVS